MIGYIQADIIILYLVYITTMYIRKIGLITFCKALTLPIDTYIYIYL